jgi:hypothetical protein
VGRFFRIVIRSEDSHLMTLTQHYLTATALCRQNNITKCALNAEYYCAAGSISFRCFLPINGTKLRFRLLRAAEARLAGVVA